MPSGASSIASARKKQIGRQELFGSAKVVGVFGGTFNPPHSGHEWLIDCALRHTNIEHILVLPTLGNILKPAVQTPSEVWEQRVKSFFPPKTKVSTNLELHKSFRTSFELSSHLSSCYSGVKFVFIFGSDFFGSITKWHNWRKFIARTDILVVPRQSGSVYCSSKLRGITRITWVSRLVYAPATPSSSLPPGRTITQGTKNQHNAIKVLKVSPKLQSSTAIRSSDKNKVRAKR